MIPQNTVDAVCSNQRKAAPDPADPAAASAPPAQKAAAGSRKGQQPVRLCRLSGLRLTAVNRPISLVQWGSLGAPAADQAGAASPATPAPTGGVRREWLRAMCLPAEAPEPPTEGGPAARADHQPPPAEDAPWASECSLQVVDRCKQEIVPLALLASAQPLALIPSTGVRAPRSGPRARPSHAAARVAHLKIAPLRTDLPPRSDP